MKTTPDTFVLHHAQTSPFTEVPLGLEGYPKEEAGIPCHYLKKEVIPVGRYVHPDDGYEIDAPAERVDKWIKNFNLMASRGVKVFQPKKHQEYDAESNLGFVVRLTREPNEDGGTSLYEIVKVVGDSRKETVVANDVSLHCKRNFKDEKGNVYDEAITHIASCPDPVISGLSGWTSIAASRGPAEQVPVLSLAASTKRSPIMDLTMLRKALGAADDVPDHQLPALAVTQLETAKSDVTRVEGEKTTALSRAKTAEEKVTELSRSIPGAPDPEVLLDRAELTLGRIDLAVEKGDMPPFIADKLKASVKPADGTPSVFMLSRNAELGRRPAELLLSFFEGSKLGVTAGEQSGQQTLELHRQIPGGNSKASDVVTPERKQELLSMTPVGRAILDTK